VHKEITLKNIFVGNLDSATTVASIRSLFEPHGAVRNLKLMTDRETGRSRGFAFVEMPAAEADRAIAALNENVVDGRQIDVREGRAKLHRGGATSGHREARA
jgi:RNA recognition motif-containing protein